MKLIALNDLHFDSRTPASRTDDYEAELLGLLAQVRQLAIKTDAAAILVAGDIFNRDLIPIPSVLKLYHWCQSLPMDCRVLVIPGNHDLRHNRLDTLPDTALGLLLAVGAVEDVSHRTYGVFPQGTGGRVHAWVSGIPFPDAMALSGWQVAGAEVLDRTTTPRIVLGHCFADTTAGDYWGDAVLGYDQLAALPWDVFIFGHDHRDQGVTRVGDKWFINLGALARGALTNEDVTREVKVALIETHPPSVTQVKLQARPAADIFNLTAHAQEQTDHAAITAFVESLKADLAGSGALALPTRVAQLTLPGQIRTRVLKYLEDADCATR